MEYIVVLGIVAAVLAVIRIGLYFGYRWIDKMLCVMPPVDPNKPIISKSSQVRK